MRLGWWNGLDTTYMWSSGRSGTSRLRSQRIWIWRAFIWSASAQNHERALRDWVRSAPIGGGAEADRRRDRIGICQGGCGALGRRCCSACFVRRAFGCGGVGGYWDALSGYRSEVEGREQFDFFGACAEIVG